MPIRAKERLCFGPFELDDSSAELFKFGQKLKLQGQPIQILSILLERPGQLVTREELRQRLWPADTATFVDFDHGLNTDIRKLRAALGDEAETPQYIETLPRRGYRFIRELTAADGEDARAVRLEVSSPLGKAADEAQSREVTKNTGADTTRAQVESRRGKKGLARGLVMGTALLLVVLALVAVITRPEWLFGPHPLRIVATKQLTSHGQVGNRLRPTVENYSSIQSDGHRIYYSVGIFNARSQLRYVPVGGGDEVTVQSPISLPSILHISPDGSTLLLKEPVGPHGNTESAIWLLSPDGGSPRKFGDIEVEDAAWAPDGRTIVFSKGQALYLTDLQGNSPVRLASTPGRAFWLRWAADGPGGRS